MTDTTTINPAIRGQTRSTWRDETHLRGVLLRLMTQYPDITRDELLEKYLAKVKGRGFRASPQAEALVDESLTRSFDNDLRLIQQPVRPRSQRSAEAVAAHAEQVRNIIIADLVQPNGKRLRDCTKAELIPTHGSNAKLIERLADRGTVGEQLSDAEIQRIYNAQG